MSQVTLYGIKNCDTIKKAKKWLDEQQVDYRFHDFRADGLNAEQLHAWCEELGYEVLLNKRGTTWRALPDDVKNSIDAQSAEALMLEQPAMIKRPVLDLGDRRVVGFKADDYQALFA
jgi:arsenate reductase